LFVRINFTGKMKTNLEFIEIAKILQNDKSKDVKFFLEGLKFDGSEENNGKIQGVSPTIRKKPENKQNEKTEENKQDLVKNEETKTIEKIEEKEEKKQDLVQTEEKENKLTEKIEENNHEDMKKEEKAEENHESIIVKNEETKQLDNVVSNEIMDPERKTEDNNVMKIEENNEANILKIEENLIKTEDLATDNKNEEIPTHSENSEGV